MYTLRFVSEVDAHTALLRISIQDSVSHNEHALFGYFFFFHVFFHTFYQNSAFLTGSLVIIFFYLTYEMRS